MGLFNSLRFRLSLIYLFTIFVPSIIMMFALPTYYHNYISRDKEVLTQGALTALERNLETYLDELEKLTIVPYYDSGFMDALKFKTNKEHYPGNQYMENIAEQTIISSLMISLQNTRKDILGTILVVNDGSIYFVAKNKLTPVKKEYNYKDKPWYKKALAADGNVTFIDSHPQDYLPSPTAPKAFSVARLIKDLDTQQGQAVIMADADTVVIEKMMKDVDFGVSSIVAIFDSNNNVIYSTSRITESMKEQIVENREIVEGKNDSFVSVSKRIDDAGWNMVVLLSRSEMFLKAKVLYITAFIFIGAHIMLAFLLFYFSSRSITQRFSEIKRVMDEAKKGNLKVRFTSHGSDEISVVGMELNKMIEQIDELIDREYRAVLSLRDVEYKALQSQIRPHFLYNTLNGFIGLNRMGKRDMLEKAIFSLTGMLRYIIEHEEPTTIKDEFMLIERYCTLQKIRFQENLEVNISLDKDVAGFIIPKLLVQPLVENAIIHGIEPLGDKGVIDVSAGLIEKNGEKQVVILVSDNGVGFDGDINGVKNVGLKNIEERLKIAYDKASFTIKSRVGEGTQAIIEIPAKEAE